MLVCDVFQAKYRKGDVLVVLFKEGLATRGESINMRILIDASGPFFTVVTEQEVENFAAWEKNRADIISQPGFGDWFKKMEPLVESGYREFFNIA